MQKQKQKRLRWDRIALVGGVALVAAYGLAAVVPDGQDYDGSDSEGRVATVLSPELEASGSAAVPAEPVTEKVLPAPAKEIPARTYSHRRRGFLIYLITLSARKKHLNTP